MNRKGIKRIGLMSLLVLSLLIFAPAGRAQAAGTGTVKNRVVNVRSNGQRPHLRSLRSLHREPMYLSHLRRQVLMEESGITYLLNTMDLIKQDVSVQIC